MIQNLEAFTNGLPAQFDGVFLWDFLKGAFGPSIMPMDLDGVVERNGFFLVFETKAPGSIVPVGQRRTFEAMRQSRRYTIIFTAKTAEDIHGWEVWTWRGRQRWIGSSRDLYNWCAAWYACANGEPLPAGWLGSLK